MAADLDAALQPDERIAYRTRGRSYVAEMTNLGIIVASLLLFTWLNGALLNPELAVALQTLMFASGAVGAAAGIIVALVMIWWMSRTADELIITDRRILFANGDWNNKLEALDLEQIQQISWVSRLGSRHLSVRGRAATIRLGRLRDADAAARAIEDASGIEAPPALGRLARFSPVYFGIVPAVFAVYLFLGVLLETLGLWPVGGAGDFGTPSMLPAVDTTAWIPAIAIGVPLGGALTLALLRPFVPAGQLQAAICAGRKNRWDVRLALGWTSLLYGRPLSYEPG